MKNLRQFLALALALVMLACVAPMAVAADDVGLDNLPAGTYTYVDGTPGAEAGSGAGQVQFLFQKEDNLVWAFGAEGGTQTGVETLSGDEYEFFLSLYISDLPAYDWLASAPRNTEGIEGFVSGNLLITVTEDGKLSYLRLESGTTQVKAVVSKEIAAPTLTVSGATRGQPNLLHSCITLVGSLNCLHLTDRGNVVLDNLKLGSNEDGVGLMASKLGGDTFITDQLYVDGEIEWFSRYANIQPTKADMSSLIVTNGQDITITGANIGRVGRDLSISTGEGGGDITIGAVVSTDQGRGGDLEDKTKGALTLSTTGDITAGAGNVIIGTNTERIVKIDTVGNIQGANITIKPTDNGTVAGVSGSLGDITATGDVEIVLSELGGTIGSITGANVKQEIGSGEVDVVSAAPTASTVVIDGKVVEFGAYNIADSNYFKLRDLAFALSGSAKQFDVYWFDNTANTTITLTSGAAYTVVGGEMAGKGAAAVDATPSGWTVYLDGKQVTFSSYNIGGNNYFKLRDIAKAFDFSVVWDGASNTITIDTAKPYTA